ncbi:MAG: hypothetical protein ABSG82_08965 [Sedimentisphaerales bacterium]|jgi:hypothetical protein
MKNDPKIEELLNGFLDGELSTQEQEQVQRFIREDADVARRLRELERCRLLVSSLPPAEPPAEVVAGIKKLLGSRTSGGAGVRTYAWQHHGTRHLFARHVLAAVVMFGFVGFLGAVIYRIVGPVSAPPSVAVQSRPAVAPQVSPQETKTVAKAEETEVGFYTLRLTTEDYVAVDAFVNKLLDESSWLRYSVTKESSKHSIYRVFCSKGGLSALVSDLSAVWPKFDSTTLVVHAGDVGQYVTVEHVQPGQIADIVNQDTSDGRIRVAKDFAVLNHVGQVSSDRQMLAFADHTYPELTVIPRPVLTSGEKTTPAVPEGANDEVRVDLSIVVSAHK